MRIFASFLAAFVAAALIGCSSGTSSGQSSTSTEATTAPETAASGASSTSATSGEMPEYPGAKTEAAGSTGMTSGGAASGKVLSTTDAFDTVYKWYQGKMPAGSEKSHMAAGGTNSAVFMTGTGSNQQSVTITTSAAMPGKTMITIAKVSR